MITTSRPPAVQTVTITSKVSIQQLISHTFLAATATPVGFGHTKSLPFEDIIQIFQATAGSLRVEEPGYWHKDRIEDRPDDIQTITETNDSGRRDIDDYKIG